MAEKKLQLIILADTHNAASSVGALNKKVEELVSTEKKQLTASAKASASDSERFKKQQELVAKAGASAAKSLKVQVSASEKLKASTAGQTKSIVKGMRESEKASQSFLQKAGSIGFVLGGVAVGATAAIAAFDKLAAAISEAHGQADTFRQAAVWDVQLSSAEKYQSILNDVRSSYSALVDLVRLKQLGVSEKEASSYAHLVNIIAAITGAEKDAVAARIESGQLTDREFRSLTKIIGVTKSRVGLSAHLLELQQKLGHELDRGDKIQGLLSYIGATQQLEASLGRLGEANPFDILKQDLKSFTDEVAKDALPAVISFAAGVVKAARGLYKFIQDSSKGYAYLIMRAKGYSAEQLATISNFDKMIKQSEEFKRKEAAKWKATLSSIKSVKKAILELGAAGKEMSDADMEKSVALIARLKFLEQQKGSRLADQLKRDYAQEQLSRQNSARTMMRNYERSYLQALASIGAKGIGPVLSGLSSSIELAKTFISLYGKGFQRIKKANDIFTVSLEKGRGGFEKLIIAENTQNQALRQQMSLSKELSDLAKLDANISRQKTMFGTAFISIERARAVLQKSQIARRYKILSMLDSTEKKLRKISAVRIELLKRMKLTVAAQGEYNKKIESIKGEQTRITLQEVLRQKLAAIKKLNGSIVRDAGDAAFAQGLLSDATVSAVEAQIVLLKKRKDLVADPQEKEAANRKIDVLQREVELRKKIATAQYKEFLVKKNLAELDALKYTQRQAMLDLTKRQSLEEAKLAARAAQTKLSGGNKMISPQDISSGNVQDVAPIAGGNLQTDLAKQVALRKEVQRLVLEIAQKRQQLNGMSEGTATKDKLQAEVEYNTKLLAIKKELLATANLQVQKDAEGLTIFGQMQQQLQTTSLKFAADMGAQLASTLRNISGGIVSAIGDIFSDIAQSGDDTMDHLAESILKGLGMLALKFAAFFAAEGIGMLFTIGGSAQGVALLAAAAGMAALGGTLVGVSAAIAKPPATHSASQSASKPPSLPSSRSVRQKERGGDVVFINTTPWDEKSPEQTYRSYKQWLSHSENVYGWGMR